MLPQDLDPVAVPPHLRRGDDAETDPHRADIRGVLGHHGDVPPGADLCPCRLVLGRQHRREMYQPACRVVSQRDNKPRYRFPSLQHALARDI